jgi:hypothetical protein
MTDRDRYRDAVLVSTDRAQDVKKIVDLEEQGNTIFVR